MDFYLAIVFIVLTALMLFCCYALVRNERVGSFFLILNQRGYDILERYVVNYYEDTEEFQHEFERLKAIWAAMCCVSSKRYNKMLLSFKPLTEENWLTEEELLFLNTDFSKYQPKCL